MEIKATELLGLLGSLIGFVTFVKAIVHSLLPAPLRDLFIRIFARLNDSFSRYSIVDIPEYDDASLNELYSAVKLHLSATSYNAAKRVKLCHASDTSDFTFSPANDERILTTFWGTQIWWEHHASQREQHSNYWSGAWRSMSDEKRTYILKIHQKDKERILRPYMKHILKQAKEIRHQSRERFLYTNSRNESYMHPWESMPFRHPSTFDTLALDPVCKAEIMGDLRCFAEGEHFYKKTGRAWKRGYLLYGPPGTGKSSMIAAMANFLRYDVYDLELTQVRCNGELRKLLLRTTNKSIIVIEDIDCSLNLTNRIRRPRREHRLNDPLPERGMITDDQHAGSMTLSGLLNFTDGLWSCCGDERIFVFTTNHIEKLDPALLRSGRMDVHILMSYCTFLAFKILARNYLGIEDHSLLPKVEQMIEDAHITPAEVSEILIRHRESPTIALQELVSELEVGKANPWPAPPNTEKEAAVEPVDVEEVKIAVEENLHKGNRRKMCRNCGKLEEAGQNSEDDELEAEKLVHAEILGEEEPQKKDQPTKFRKVE